MDKPVASPSLIDRVVVILGGVFCAAGIGWGVTSSAVAADRPSPRYSVSAVSGTAARVPGRSHAPETTRPDSAESQIELEWSDITGYRYVEGMKNLPETIRALEGKRIVLRGYLSILYEYDNMHEFMLIACPASCCFTPAAGISGQVQVKITSETGLPNTNEPIEVSGTFHAVETMEQGYVLSIYRIDGAAVRIVPWK